MGSRLGSGDTLGVLLSESLGQRERAGCGLGRERAKARRAFPNELTTKLTSSFSSLRVLSS